MGKCTAKVTEIRFVLEDELTECYVAVEAEGDCPIGVQGWHHKTFPKSQTAQQILDNMTHADGYLLWPQDAPAPKK